MKLRIFTLTTMALVLSACASAGAPDSYAAQSNAAFVPAGGAHAPQAQSKRPVVYEALSLPLTQFPNTIGLGPTGIRANLISAGYAVSGGVTHGLIYNRLNGVWTQLDYPGATSTLTYGPDQVPPGYRAVGSYKLPGSPDDRSFVYDSATNTYTTLNVPTSFCGSTPCNQALAHSAYGKSTYKVVGNCDAVTGKPSQDWKTYPPGGHAWLYDSKTNAFTEIDVPKAISTTAYGIWINGSAVAVAGGYTDAKGTHAYVRDIAGTQKLVFDYPGSKVTHFEGIAGAGGAGDYNVSGDYLKSGGGAYGFFLEIRNWKAGKPVPLRHGSADSVYQNVVVGTYHALTFTAGYIATVQIAN